ncbi:helix-turn-helix domain-containing protein [Rhizobium gallicum]|uniref:helix-turn-helix domain-containing protein n=1 Tax=Rhizobium gallicum TaxID=56730 RepID=UPI001EF772A7|nr:YdaS family helix-turn-helix protein [Rhizobium gallicum]ULJ73629.1 helix-turn-helix domain-containing protein [Rhizobium gallicum]
MSTETAFSTFRKNSGLTLDAVADMFKVDRTTILRWEKGEPPVPIKRVAEIAAATGISRHDLRPDVFGQQPETAE